jgi:uncharacterized ion transporter superfamily protein YfcC
MPRTLRFPHPLVLLVACIGLAAALTWLLPAGEFDRRDDAATGRTVVVAGTYHRVDPVPVGPFRAAMAIPRGIAEAASVVGLVFLIGGAFMIVERTGTLARLVEALVRRLERRELLVIPVSGVVFALAGALMQMQEELIAFVPILLVLTRRLGFDALTAVAMSLGAAAVGAAFSPVNPFQVVIAQKLAELPPSSALGYRLLFLVPALALWLAGTMRYAARTRTAPAIAPSAPPGETAAAPASGRLDWRDLTILALIVGTFATYVYGAQRLGWEFDQLSALFFIMGVVAGLVGRLRIEGTAEAFVDGLRAMAFSALVIGFARAISVVLTDGKVIDTVVHGLFTPIAELPVALSALGMMVVHAGLHLPVPSTSGQAVLTMPVLVPLSDLLGLSRQVTVLAYQYGAGLTELITPTNGALMAMLAAAGVGYDRWLRFAVPLFLLLFGVGALAVVAGIAAGI